jgi:microcystin-dependent protein
MSIQAVDNYFPFTTGLGAAATVARWRLMARNWVVGGSGVLANYLNQCFPSIAGSTVTIGTGAVWVDGFYGEIDTPKTLTISGNGMVVARMDPTAQIVEMVFVANQTVPTQNLTGIYEVGIAQISGGTLTDLRPLLQPTINLALPTGMITPFAGTTPPPGWLLCNGNPVSRSLYAVLFTVIGTTYGAGDNTTTFNVPDLRGRTAIGAGAGAGLSARTPNQTGGVETVTLNAATNGWHAHWNGSNYATGGQSADHYHEPIWDAATGTNIWPAGRMPNPVPANEGFQASSTGTKVTFISTWRTSGTLNDHIHGIAGEGGNAHENMPPWIAINMMIKT